MKGALDAVTGNLMAARKTVGFSWMEGGEPADPAF